MSTLNSDLNSLATSVNYRPTDAVRWTKVLAHAPGFTVIENL
jgi:hypothetical protein